MGQAPQCDSNFGKSGALHQMYQMVLQEETGLGYWTLVDALASGYVQ